MTHRTYTITLWSAAALTCLTAAMFVYAVTVSVTAGVAAAGPFAATTGAAAAAWKARHELRATHVTDLASANQREDDIATR